MKLMQYLLDVSIIWTIFYLVYYLLLRKETFFQINRLFLLSALPIGLLLPILRLLDFTINLGSQAESIVQPISTAISLEALNTPIPVDPQPNLGFTLVVAIYFLGVFYTILRMIRGFQQIFFLYKNGDKSKMGKHHLIKTNSKHLPFSFFNYIFWGNIDHIEWLDERKILAHELVHVKEFHSVDVILLECLCILFWWNPLVYLYRHQIRQNHEFICDQGAQLHHSEFGQNKGPGFYGDFYLGLANHFFNSHLKNRIIMISKSPSASWLRWKSLMIFPIVCLIAAAFAFSVEQPPSGLLPLVKCTIEHEDIHAQSACTHKEILIHVYKAVRYPKEARDNSLTGYAILGATFNKDGLVSHTFLFETDPVFHPALTDVSTALKDLQFNIEFNEELSLLIPVVFRLHGINDTIEIPKNIEDKYPSYSKIDQITVTSIVVDKELRIDKSIEKNIPLRKGKPVEAEETPEAPILRWAVNEDRAIIKHGEVTMEAGEIRIESSFETNQVESNATPETEFPLFTPISESSLLGRDTGSAPGWSRDTEPLIMLFDANGEIVDGDYKHENPFLDPSKIESISVIKGSSAIGKYGPRAENGVVEIYLKKKIKRKNKRSKVVLRKKKKNQTPRDISTNNIDVSNNLLVFPNPARNHLDINFESEQESLTAKYYVLDLQGKIQEGIENLQINGKWVYSMDINHLPSGHYYFILEENGVKHQKAFEVVR